jgi:hypothetical protein
VTRPPRKHGLVSTGATGEVRLTNTRFVRHDRTHMPRAVKLAAADVGTLSEVPTTL